MSATLLILLSASLWIATAVIAIALCVAAKRGDEQMAALAYEPASNSLQTPSQAHAEARCQPLKVGRR